MMDFPTSFNDAQDSGDQTMPDSPGNALGALKKVVEGRQKRNGTTIEAACLTFANMTRTFLPEHPQSTQPTLGRPQCLKQQSSRPLRSVQYVF
jgi:hypothetical protein